MDTEAMTPAAKQLVAAYARARKRGANKFHAKKALHNGHLYHSGKEADYARELDLRVKVGELKEYKRQVRYPLKVNGKLVCSIIPDYLLIYPDGHEQIVEIKGYPTPEWRIKWKLFEALYPKLDKRII